MDVHIRIPTSLGQWRNAMAESETQSRQLMEDMRTEFRRDIGKTGDITLDAKIQNLADIVALPYKDALALSQTARRANLHARIALPPLMLAAFAPLLHLPDDVTHVVQGLGVASAAGIGFFDMLSAALMGSHIGKVLKRFKTLPDPYFTQREEALFNQKRQDYQLSRLL